MIRKEEVYKIGRIGKPHGVKGEVTFHFVDDVFDRVDADFLLLSVDDILVPFYMEEYRFRTDETALVKFCDIDTQEQARELTHCDVFFLRSMTDDDSDEGLSWAQITGFSLLNAATGKTVGTIRSVDDSTLNILFEIETPDGNDILVPAHEELIEQVDGAKRRIVVRLPEGLLEL